MFNLGSLGGLFVSLGVDTAEFEGDLGKAASIAERQAARINTAAVAIGTSIGDGITAAARAAAAMIKNTIEAGDQLAKMSARTGFTVERLSELEYAAKLADVSFDQLKTSLGFFNKAIAEAADPTSKQAQLFQALGVDISQGAQPAFEQFLKSVQELPNHETKVAAMRVAFSRSGDALLQMAGGMDDATESARKLGIVIGADMAKQSEQFNDNITKLGATTRALAINVSGPLVGGLSELTDSMVRAAERGEKFKGFLIESLRLTAALAGTAFPMLQDAVTKFYTLTDQVSFGAVSGKIRRPGNSDVNAEMAACAVSGGKWVNGACQHGRQKKGRDDSGFLGRQLNEGMEEEARVMAEASAASEDLRRRERAREYEEARAAALGIDTMNKTTEMLREEIDLRLKSIDADIEGEEVRMRAYAGFDAQGRAVQQNLKAQISLAQDLGLTFTSAFEEAAIKTRKFSEILKGLAQDLARLAIRKTVTEPMGQMLSAYFMSVMSAAGAGAGAGADSAPIATAVGGPRRAGQTLLVGEHGPELFTPSTDGMMIPNHELGGGGPVFNVDMRGASLDAVARLESLVMQVNGSIETRAINAMRDVRARGA